MTTQDRAMMLLLSLFILGGMVMVLLLFTTDPHTHVQPFNYLQAMTGGW